MHLPDYVEPFVDTDAGRWRVTGAVVCTIALALWSENQSWVLGYPLALAVGAAAAWWIGSRSGNHESGDALPRLPVFLRFDDRRAVVVGGGNVAAAKIPALLSAGARVTVIAPEVSSEVRRQPVDVVERPFTPADLDGAWFVTAAATPDVNRAVRNAADERGLFVNAVDDPANATAYLGGTIARGGVTVAFSTSGKAPALAGLLREALDVLLPDDIDAWARRASELSREQRRDGVPMAARRPELLRALNELYDSREVRS